MNLAQIYEFVYWYIERGRTNRTPCIAAGTSPFSSSFFFFSLFLFLPSFSPRVFRLHAIVATFYDRKTLRRSRDGHRLTVSMGYHLQAKSLAALLLGIAATGGVVLTALLAPNALQLFASRSGYAVRQRWQRAERRRIHEELKRLRRRRLITLDEKEKETFITVTAAGRQHVRKFRFDALELTAPKRWDEKWRVVVFDIPERQARRRQAFQGKLRQLGFQQFQRSVWIYPHACQDEIDFLTQFLEIGPHVTCLETASLERREGEARRVFHLL